jgi:hypothetical protein
MCRFGRNGWDGGFSGGEKARDIPCGFGLVSRWFGVEGEVLIDKSFRIVSGT